MLRWLLWCIFFPVLLPLFALRVVRERFWPCTALQLHIHGPLPDVRTGRSLKSGGPSLLTLVRALEHAVRDPKLQVVHVHLEQAALGLGQAEELRAMFARLKGSGKQVVLRAESLGLAGYWVALGASKVVLCPTGALDVAGVASEFTLLRGLLDKVGLRARMLARGRYKSMREMFTEVEISAENRAMLTSIVGELYGLLIDRVAEARSITVQEARERIDEGPLRASEALRLGLIDELAYPADLEEQLEADDNRRVFGVEEYLRAKERRFWPRRPALVGILEVGGNIATGDDGVGLGFGRTTGAKSFVEQVRRAKKNRRIKALLLRVNSPGGSALGSDMMWQALKRAQVDKPIVVSMGDIAASGGYYVSGLQGATVLANPTTLTGSIGVVAGKWEADVLIDKLGVRRELVHAGRHAGYYSPTVPWGPEEEAKLARDVDALYVDFVGKMAAARGKPFAEFEPLAQGRVWTGSQAVANGLVDVSGGLSEAMVHLRQAVKGAPGKPLAFVSMARRPGWRRVLGVFAAARGNLLEPSPTGMDQLVRLSLPFDIRFK